MVACPSCGFVQQAGMDECSRCGVIFSKMEKDEVRKMQTDQALEEAQQRAEQIRQEWDDRAKQILESRPIAEAAGDTFQQGPDPGGNPLPAPRDCAEGPLLMTSRQILGLVEGTFVHVPYEIIKDVDFGGGLVVKKGHTRLVLHFHAPILFKDKNVNSITWQLDADRGDQQGNHHGLGLRQILYVRRLRRPRSRFSQ